MGDFGQCRINVRKLTSKSPLSNVNSYWLGLLVDEPLKSDCC